MMRARIIDKRRMRIASTCWLLSALGLLASISVFMGTVEALATGTSDIGDSEFIAGCLLLPVAWTALARMCSAWVTHGTISQWWPHVGMFAGLCCAATFTVGLLFVLPCSLLAIYLWFEL